MTLTLVKIFTLIIFWRKKRRWNEKKGQRVRKSFEWSEATLQGNKFNNLTYVPYQEQATHIFIAYAYTHNTQEIETEASSAVTQHSLSFLTNKLSLCRFISVALSLYPSVLLLSVVARRRYFWRLSKRPCCLNYCHFRRDITNWGLQFTKTMSFFGTTSKLYIILSSRVNGWILKNFSIPM